MLILEIKTSSPKTIATLYASNFINNSDFTIWSALSKQYIFRLKAYALDLFPIFCFICLFKINYGLNSLNS